MVLRRIIGPSLETGALPDAALAGNVCTDYGWASVMTVQEKCDEKSGSRSSRCADISTPTLRKVREGWGTPCVIYVGEIKSLGHPAR